MDKMQLLGLIQNYGQASREFGRAMVQISERDRMVAAEAAANAAFERVLDELFPLARVQTQEPMERASRELGA